ncbi:uncharacterized protein LOC123031100 [Varanus komodoensis]|uniref:uncharacterized protein LOC123031100 n=1 Tax=Varanus komodoensis TaxID=61221 RepID=UPI001CF7A809|nr:uncharacterized protein LOC123031100 [Varanus komodoensis]
MPSQREPPRLTVPGNRFHSGKMQESRKGDGSLGTSSEVSMNSESISGEEMIRKRRKQIIEVIEKDLELFLDESVSQSVITEEEYAALDKSKENAKKKTRTLLLLLQKRGGAACTQFLECLEVVCPGTNGALQRSIREHSFPEEQAEHSEVLEEKNKEGSKGISFHNWRRGELIIPHSWNSVGLFHNIVIRQALPCVFQAVL